ECLVGVLLFFQRCADPRDLHSFPTRRSSDLSRAVCAALEEGRELRPEDLHNDLERSVLERYSEVARARNDLLSAGAELVRLSGRDRKSTRLNSSHVKISYAVFCLKKKKTDSL